MKDYSYLCKTTVIFVSDDSSQIDFVQGCNYGFFVVYTIILIITLDRARISKTYKPESASEMSLWWAYWIEYKRETQVYFKII